MNTGMNIRVRFAPSPTGHLHIGGLRTAFFNWLFARHYNGAFLLRVEDTDKARSQKSYMDSQLASLAWAGLSPDEPIVIQSQQIDHHKAVIEKLCQEGKAYRCYCSPDDIATRAQERGNHDIHAGYDGFCRDRSPMQTASYAVRFRLPDNKTHVSFDDLIHGPISFGIDQFDDFIIARSDGNPIYNFVVVVDDATMAITHVIRGDDHISNTPKQILLYEACGYPIPQFAHLPLILGPSGQPLSKRDAATSVHEYIQGGYLPHALLNYLVRLGWAHGDQEIFSMQELISYFSLEHVGKKGAVFDTEKLNWVNGFYVRAMPGHQLWHYLINIVDDRLSPHLSGWNDQQKIEAVDIFKQRVSTVRELAEQLSILYDGPTSYNQDDYAQWIGPHSGDHIKALEHVFNQQEPFSADALSTSVKKLAKERDVKLVIFAQLIRLALLGKASGPGVFELLSILGKKESIARMDRLYQTLVQK